MTQNAIIEEHPAEDLPQMIADPISDTVLPRYTTDVRRIAPSQAWGTEVHPLRASCEAPTDVNQQDLDVTTVTTPKEEFRPAQEAWYIGWSRRVVGNRIFVACTTLLTVWALAGDDLRILGTDKPADPIFDVLAIFSMLVFTFEIVVSCFGSEDYFMGFFFWLDVVSTCTLVMDLTAVRDAMSGSSSDYDRARSSKTARIGAKLGRMARVLRIIRIVKLFKAYYSTDTIRKRRSNTSLTLEFEEEDDFDFYFKVDTNETESLVSKKLSTKMTQRTIIVVLVLLVVMPQLSPDYYLLMQTSAEYGADDLHETFDHMVKGTVSRSAYEELFLQYAYFHNWFLGHGSQTCPKEALCATWYFGHAFWFGFAGKNHTAVRRSAELGRIRHQSVQSWELGPTGRQDYRYFLGSMPSQARDKMWMPWATDCPIGDRLYRGFSLLSTELKGVVEYLVVCPDDLRKTESVHFTPQVQTSAQKDEVGFMFVFDLRPFNRQEALLSLLTTVCVCVILCVASTMFSHDANVLVLQPLEQMMSKMVAIRENPLSAVQLADDEFRREEAMRRKSTFDKHRRWSELLRWTTPKKNQKETMETVILEKTMVKLGTLLALGFGEAGADIVRHNMTGSNTSGVNAMIEGSKVNCIIGCTGIRDFDIATEVLQGNVMRFVNQISEIVHGIVDECTGAINKNNGSGFLAVWRAQGMDEHDLEKTADLSVYAFARILGAVHRSTILAQYRTHPGLKLHLASRCRVNLSFGLHYGWAIEGAVGSEFKIDASYLSPNVSLANTMETATRIYGVHIIASETVVDLCTSELAEQLRLIDNVVVNGSKAPLRIYCLDLDHLKLKVDPPRSSCDKVKWDSVQRYKARKVHKSRKLSLWGEQFPIGRLLADHEDIVKMREGYTLEFLQVFNMGYQNYSEGEWSAAKQYLSKTLIYLGEDDGPSTALLEFIESNGCNAPADWCGVHDIRHKLDSLNICH